MDSLKPRGRVVITNNKTNEVLVDKHNMILQSGRIFLAGMFGQSAFGNGINLVNGDNDENAENLYTTGYRLESIVLLPSTSAPSYKEDIANDVYTSRTTTARYIPFKENGSESGGNVSIVVSRSEDYPYILIEMNYNDSEPINQNKVMEVLGSLFISLKQESANNYLTFSQICFDPILITDDTDLNIKYYIYF